MHLFLSDDAKADLHSIKEYLEPRSEQGYARVINAIFSMFDVLESSPNLGRSGQVEGTREITVSRTEYRIVYTLRDAYNIDVERILHSRLKYPHTAKGS